MTPAPVVRPTTDSSQRHRWRRFFPALEWISDYSRDNFSSDLIAGLVVAIMLVPQSMAYALLAGLPPQVGLYASILPLIIYGLMGSSRVLAVGPVAIISLLVATSVSPLAEPGSVHYVQLALTLALLAGLIQLGLGLVRLGALVNFLSHPVISGFTSAAAIVIGWSQLKNLLGFSVPRGEFVEQVRYTLAHLGESNLVTLGLGVMGIVLLWLFRTHLADWLRRLRVPSGWVIPLSRSGPLLIVVLGALLVWALGLNDRAGVDIVGEVPSGLPPLTLPPLVLSTWERLLPAAFVISFVSYLESISVAKSFASKRRQKIDANQELVALGMANLGATITGGYPVTGGFSRSSVNFAAGAYSGMSNIITALLVAVALIFLTPLFFYLPQSILAAIIIVAVADLFDLEALRHAWRYDRADGASLVITFLAVLLIGVEQGILVGAVATIALYLWRTSHPHVAVVGRLQDSEVYRHEERHDVETWPHVRLIRVDESLYFANSKFLEDTILGAVADDPELEYLVLIGVGINFIDASALDVLEELHRELQGVGVQLHFASLKGPVMDRLRKIGFVQAVGEERFHLSPHDTMIALGLVASPDHHNGRAELPAYAPLREEQTPKKRHIIW